MRRLLLALCALTAFALSLTAFADGENIINNGDFESVQDGMPTGWEKAMWFTDEGVSLLTVEADGYEGNCISVRNVGINDARFVQTISVEPDSIYRITAMCRASGIPESSKGATLSVDSTFSYSNEAFDTNGEWIPLELYGHTGSDQTEVKLFARVGGYGSENSGQAWFDNISMVKLDAAPSGANVQELAKPASNSSSSSTDEDEDTDPPRNTQAWILLSCLWVLAAIAVARKFQRSHAKSDGWYRYAMLLMLLAALAVRLVLAARVPGYNTDINCFSSWAQRMVEYGPAGFYGAGWCDYPPLYMWMLAPIAVLINAFGLAYRSGGQLILIKLWPILFDLAAAWLIWNRSKKQLGARAALLLAALFALNPAVFTDSAAWGQIDSIFTLMIALSALDADDDRYIPSLVWFTLAMLTKPQALLFAPIGLFAICVRLIREKKRASIRNALIGLGCALVMLLLAGIVSAGFSEGALQPVVWLRDLYSGTLQGYSYVDINALNLHYLLGFNWTKTAEAGGVTLLAWLFFAFSYVYCAMLYLRSKRAHALPLVGGTLIMLICTFGPMIHERYIYPAVLLLLLAYAYTHDRRLLAVVLTFSFTLFMNEVLVLQGGMTQANFGHLHTEEDIWINFPVCVLSLLNACFMAWTAWDICINDRVWIMKAVAPEPNTQARISLLTPADHRLHMRPVDYILIAAVTVIYAVVAFANLGVASAPQTTWTASEPDEEIVFDLGSVQKFRLTYYGNICTSNFTVSFSNDGEEWTEPCYAQYGQGDIFRWIWYRPLDSEKKVISAPTLPTEDGSVFIAYSGYEGENYPYQTARFAKLTTISPGLKLMEVGFLNEEGEALPIAEVVGGDDPSLLIDEQNTIPDHPSYLNGTYFDEIYHPRTAYEHLHGLQTYEYTHPPLGKVMMMIGIQLFGMTPFGWRFMGTLMGVLMVPLMYLLVKQLTKSTKLSFIAMFLLSVDSMHFTQTRLATIDSYSVFWIMLMYLFMFRFTQMNWHTKAAFKRSLVVLGLCGISMGLGWATKWICFYASAGLAVLFFWTLWRHYCEYSEAQHDRTLYTAELGKIFPSRCLFTIGFCLIFFVVIPVLIYYFSYYWHLQFLGVQRFTDMFSTSRVKTILELQRSMFNYHSGLGGDTHPFRSPWYQWPVIAWPMWYYSGTDYVPSGMISSISCMGNPAVFWFCLAALIFIAIRAAVVRRAPKAYVLTLIGFASQFLPWVLVPRSTFIYHYFASVPFIIIAGVLALDWIRGKSRKSFYVAAVALMVAALALFIAFYPLESGMPVARAYAQHLRWFNWANF